MVPIKETEREALFVYLDQILEKESSTLVGKICKRFEIIDDKSVLKSNIKELIYEEFRKIREIFSAYSYGLEESRFIFKTKE